jgi:soluble lytic murein transglycosylase
MASRADFRLSSPVIFNKPPVEILTMPLLRALLFSTAFAATALAQSLPEGLTRQGNVVMMQPIEDANSEASPGLVDARPSRLRVLSASDHDLFARAFESGRRGDWTGARILAAQGQSPIAKQILEWRYALDKNSGATFAEIDAVINATEAKTAAGTWPLRGTLQARAETALTPDMPPASVIAWFANKTPNSSIGKIRLGEALVASEEKNRGGELIRQGWEEGSFDPATELAIVQKDAIYLRPDSDRRRLEALLWRGEITAAKRQMSRVDAPSAQIGNARIALYTQGWPEAQAVVKNLQDNAAAMSDPGLLLDWSRALRIAGRDQDARAVLLRIKAASLVKDHPARWWAEVNVQARDGLQRGEPREAYDLVQHAGFSSGEQYMEQQFLAGFLALRFLKEPETAMKAFQRLDAMVSRPISKSRAQYWLGRSLEAQGDTTAALAHYRLAAAYPETFYGQIALSHIQPDPILHLDDTVLEAANASDLDGDPLMPQIKVLADLGQADQLRLFIDRDAQTYDTPRHIKRLMLLLNDWGYPEIAVRLAKNLSYSGIYLPQFTHPVIGLPSYPGPGAAPDPALVLGLIRQETEFDAYAVSAPGARGLMQMMPASAKLAAKKVNLAYRPDALLTDTAYNIVLGITEYDGHLQRYGGSQVLAIASYNAGPNNVKKWLAINGDPRLTDPIDWIEQTPFAETRNYVQRVLENTQVYRSRLAGKDVALQILNDLYAPNPPAMPMLAAK